MRCKRILLAFLLILLYLTASAWAQERSEAKEQPSIALTFDDLPAHGSLPPGVTRMQVAEKIIGALREAHVPAVYGFVNGVAVERQPQDAAVLSAWRDGGQLLANHGWSHMNLNQHTQAEYEAEIAANEALLAANMKDADWRWFRYPYLAEGETPEKRVAIRTFMAHKGYKIAAVTMGFADYLWTEPYARCKAKGDAQSVALLESAFLKAADENIAWYRTMSKKLYGRDIAYVLLMHFGALDAEMMPRLLQLYKDRGFKFVTLADAEKDDFYKMHTDLRLAPGPGSLEGEMYARHLELPTRPDPGVQFESLCK
jgi:peptidoglycan/xylan/chitin deacetylase (PgdA/CDA1 family)